MKREIANELLSELQKHAPFTSAGTRTFLDALIATPTPEQTELSTRVAENNLLFRGSNSYSMLTLKRVIRNENAGKQKPSLFERLYDAVSAGVGSYSSDALVRRILTTPRLVEMMSRSSEFSLLGKMTTYDVNQDRPNQDQPNQDRPNQDRPLLIENSPILVIPGADKPGVVDEWETANTTYEKEVGIFLRRQRRISHEEYEEYLGLF